MKEEILFLLVLTVANAAKSYCPTISCSSELTNTTCLLRGTGDASSMTYQVDACETGERCYLSNFNL